MGSPNDLVSDHSGALEVYRWNQEGYMPLVLENSWQVALLNWEPPIDAANVGDVERHNRTDEVFILLAGHATLFVIPRERTALEIVEMDLGTVYNVPAGTWHNLLATRDVSFAIVEARDTHVEDTEIRRMSAEEVEQLRCAAVSWFVNG